MKANELRIGNLVLLHCKNEKDEIAKLLTIDEIDGCYYNRASNKMYINKKYDQVKNGWCKFNIIQPIPLTEKWLLKFGYTEEDFETGKIIIVTENNKLIGFIINKYSYSPIIKYVHQLQNLYFALTGIELTLNK
jgi:hypothetical protein